MSAEEFEVPVRALVRDNVDLLSRAITLLRCLDDDTYTRVFDGLTSGSIGDHLRHVHDGYLCLTRGLTEGQVDYDDRARDARIATSTTHAARALGEQIECLEGLMAKGTVAVGVRAATSTEREPAWLPSSLARELAFVHSHTVHHFALIAVLLRVAGRPVDDEFGVAPSTLLCWREGTGARQAN